MSNSIEFSVSVRSEVLRSARRSQVEGLFELPPSLVSERTYDVSMALPPDWNVGVIVGPSMAGKSTVARELAKLLDTQLVGDRTAAPYAWPADKSLVDGFPAGMGIRDITGLLSSVGFSSPPDWLKPFHALSNGGQFRVTLARTLAETKDGQVAMVDEFSSVVDRKVAQIGSAAIAKSIRRSGKKFVAVSCHYDILDWLEPDWVYEPADNRFTVNVGPDGSRGSLWRRPKIDLKVIRTDRTTWDRVRAYHYLDHEIHPSASCFAGLVDGQLAAFTAVLSFPHATAPGWREHRTVCVPDFQGVGIGNAMSECVASMYAATGKPYRSTTSNPAMYNHRRRSSKWKVIRPLGLSAVHSGNGTGMKSRGAVDRQTESHQFVGALDPRHAKAFRLPI